MSRSLFLLATALALGTSANAMAQGGGGGMGGGSSYGGGGGGSGGLGGGTSTGGGTSFTGGGTTTFTGGGTSGGTTTFTGGGTSFTGGGTTGTGGTGGGIRGGAGTSGFSPSPTNFMNKTATNPLWVGRPGSTNISAKTPGGFGQPTLPSSAAAGGRAGGGTASVNRGAATGLNSGTNGNRTTPAITYAMEVKFPTTPIASSQFQADLQGVVSRSSQLKTPGNVRVDVVGTTVVLRGIVADDDEKRLVEGMVRLEPGVQAVQNELAIIPPKP